MFSLNLREMFVPEHSLLEVVARGTLTYLILFLILRFFLKRQSGVIGIADLLVIVLIADAAQNAMANEYKSITEGALLVLTIVFWNFAIDWLGFRFPRFRWITRPAPLPLIKNGVMLRRNMQQEMITTEELNSQLRQKGVAFIEGDGQISVIKFQESEDQDAEKANPLKK